MMSESHWWVRYGNFEAGEGAYPHVGQVIAHYRKKRGWTQESLAIALGCSKKTVEDLEGPKGMNGPDIERRKTLVKLLGIPPALLALDWRIQPSNVSDSSEHTQALVEEDTYSLYEHLLVLGWGCLSNGRNEYLRNKRLDIYTPKLAQIAQNTSELEREPWLELLSNFYQVSARYAQHGTEKAKAISYAKSAIEVALPLNNAELLATALFRRAVIYFEQSATLPDPIQQQTYVECAKNDIDAALRYSDRARPKLKGNIYLLAAEIYASISYNDATQRKQCEKWHEKTANLIYRGEFEDEGNFLKLNISALHHEKAKMFLLQGHLREARGELNLTWKTLPTDLFNWRLNTHLTEARLYKAEHDLEGSVHAAIDAYHMAHAMHSTKGKRSVQKIYKELQQIDPNNPYVCRLGILLDEY